VPGNAVSSVGFLWVLPAADTELWGFCGGANTQVGEMVLTSRRDGTSTIELKGPGNGDSELGVRRPAVAGEGAASSSARAGWT
jgi:hypothetical protein